MTTETCIGPGKPCATNLDGECKESEPRVDAPEHPLANRATIVS